jgi:hypothetical protein
MALPFRIAASVGLVVFALEATAGARELAYIAPDVCPTRDEVVSRLDGNDGRPAKIEVSRDGAGYHGVVVLGDGSLALTRAVDARTCGAVVDALALVVALDVPGFGDAKEDVASEDAATAAEPRDAPSPAPRAPERAPYAPMRHGVDVTLGLLLSGTTFTDGHVLQGASLFGDVGARRSYFVPFFRPSARLALEQTLTTARASSGFASKFQLTTGALEACPLGIDVVRDRLSVTACGRGELGTLKASAGAGDDFGFSRLWATAGGIGRARLELGSAPSVRWVIEIGGGALAPVIRDRFWDYNAMVTEVPKVLVTGFAGVGVILP